MSTYVIYYNTRKILYRQMAESWKAWADTTKLTKDQVRGMSVFFRHIGKRFGLITEFKILGVI